MATANNTCSDRTVGRRTTPILAISCISYFMIILELLPEVPDGRLDPGKIFDCTTDLDEVPSGYHAMDHRECLKVLVRP